MNPTEQAHEDLRKILLTGRILINRLPLTGNELGIILQGEQMLFGKAMKLDAAEAFAAKQAEKPPKKKPDPPKENIVPIAVGKKKG